MINFEEEGELYCLAEYPNVERSWPYVDTLVTAVGSLVPIWTQEQSKSVGFVVNELLKDVMVAADWRQDDRPSMEVRVCRDGRCVVTARYAALDSTTDVAEIKGRVWGEGLSGSGLGRIPGIVDRNLQVEVTDDRVVSVSVSVVFLN